MKKNKIPFWSESYLYFSLNAQPEIQILNNSNSNSTSWYVYEICKYPKNSYQNLLVVFIPTWCKEFKSLQQIQKCATNSKVCKKYKSNQPPQGQSQVGTAKKGWFLFQVPCNNCLSESLSDIGKTFLGISKYKKHNVTSINGDSHMCHCISILW